jgi:hypothetical protein
VLRIIRHASLAAVALAVVLLAAAFTAPRWLGPVLAALLPPAWHLDELALASTGARLTVSAAGCRLLELDGGRVRLRWKGPVPQLEAVEIATLSVDPACLPAAGVPAGSSVELPDGLGAVLGGARLVVDRLTVADWLVEPHRVELAAAAGAVRLAADGPLLHLDGTWVFATGEGGLRASLPVAGPVTDLVLQGSVRAGRDRTAGVALAARVDGAVPATGSRLDGELEGHWQSGGGTVTTLRLGLDQLATPVLTALRPRLELQGPARFDLASGQVAAALVLGAERVNLADAGRLDRPRINLQLAGDLAMLAWTAEATAGRGLGPVAGEGQWSGTGLRGRVTLDGQALPALQGVLPPTLPVELKGGTATAALTFNWSPAAPAELGLEGELKLADGELGGTHWAAERVVVRLPFRYAGGALQLGGEYAGQVTVGGIIAAVPAEALSLRVAGAWPWSARAPLRLEGLRLRLLGGEATLDTLRLPQRGQPVTLRLRGIQLEQVSALHGDEVVSLRGAVDAELPLRLDHGSLLVADGIVRNATPVRLRLTDVEGIAAFKASNPALAQATDWLSDLHVDRLEGTVNLRRDGTLLLVASIDGRNPGQGDRSVRLNYRHEENLLHLLQSLRIGSDLSRSIEERLSPRLRSGQ